MKIEKGKDKVNSLSRKRISFVRAGELPDASIKSGDRNGIRPAPAPVYFGNLILSIVKYIKTL